MAYFNDISWLVIVSCCSFLLYFKKFPLLISQNHWNFIFHFFCPHLNLFSKSLGKWSSLLLVVLSLCSHWYHKDDCSSSRWVYFTSQAFWSRKRYQSCHHFVFWHQIMIAINRIPFFWSEIGVNIERSENHNRIPCF